MFSPQLNEAKYNFLSADINKCGGKGKRYRWRAFARENSNLKRKNSKEGGKMLKSTLGLAIVSNPSIQIKCNSGLACFKAVIVRLVGN